MSTENKSGELVTELIRATEEGQVTWHPTARIDEFTCTLQGRFSILLSKGDNGEISFRMLDTDDRELLNIPETTAKTLGIGRRSSVMPIINPLGMFFDLVRRNALHVDQAIDDVLQGLKRS